MGAAAWERICWPAVDDDSAWETFHENSKGSPYENLGAASRAAVWRDQLPGALEFDAHPRVDLPKARARLDLPLARAITGGGAVRELEPETLTLEELGTLLRYAYGVVDEPGETGGGRDSRVVPSVSGLHPLELFFHTTCVAGLEAGLYYYHPVRHHLRWLRAKAQNHHIAPGLVDKTLATQASVIVFLAAQPERAVVPYGDRGYRFVLLQAGAVVQNVNLTARGLGLACVNVGEFYDRQVDRFLGFDGLGMSTIFVLGIGKVPGESQPLPSVAGRETN